MKKNWYILYVKHCMEFKVASLLSKEKIDNFCPVNRAGLPQPGTIKKRDQPLFRTYVFALLNQSELSKLQKFYDVISIVHFRDKPAIVSEDEINSIKKFTLNYSDIELETIPIGKDTHADIIMEESISFKGGHLYSIRNDCARLQLPSLGIMLVAPIREQPVAREKMLLPERLAKQFQLNFFNF